jgi:hypothetical protein
MHFFKYVTISYQEGKLWWGVCSTRMLFLSDTRREDRREKSWSNGSEYNEKKKIGRCLADNKKEKESRRERVKEVEGRRRKEA